MLSETQYRFPSYHSSFFVTASAIVFPFRAEIARFDLTHLPPEIPVAPAISPSAHGIVRSSARRGILSRLRLHVQELLHVLVVEACEHAARTWLARFGCEKGCPVGYHVKAAAHKKLTGNIGDCRLPAVISQADVRFAQCSDEVDLFVVPRITAIKRSLRS